MTANHDLERQIMDYYATESPSRAPDRLLAGALMTIESTPQRRALAPWRFRPLNSYMKFAVAAVAIVALTALAVPRLLPADNGSTPSATPTATSTPIASPTPSPTVAAAVPVPEGDLALPTGRYVLDMRDSVVDVELTVGEAGWSGNGWYVADGRRALSFWQIANVYGSSCADSTLPDPPVAATVEAVVAALDAQVGTEMQADSKQIVGGYPSTRVIMRPSPGMDRTCRGGILKMWVGPAGVDGSGRSLETVPSPGGEVDVIWIIDVEGTIIAIVGYYDESDANDADAILAMIDSISFVVP